METSKLKSELDNLLKSKHNEETRKSINEIMKFSENIISEEIMNYNLVDLFNMKANLSNRIDLYIDLDKEQVVIKPKGGFGGLGGEYIKPTALANVRAFRERLNPSIKIIGTGGVINGKDVFEHILCGADLVQVGTTLHKEGVAAFSRLTKELEEVMKEKGYKSLDDFRGKLKVIE